MYRNTFILLFDIIFYFLDNTDPRSLTPKWRSYTVWRFATLWGMSDRKFLDTIGQPTRKYDRDALLTAFICYVWETDVPIFKEFCWMNGVTTATIYEWAEFQPAIEWCRTKKEAMVERRAMENDKRAKFAIFQLKNMGWSDTTKHEITGANGGPVASVAVTADMSPEAATAAYLKLVGG